MPVIDDEIMTAAAPRAVWKVLYDPLRFPEWWTGLDSVVPGDAKGGSADITMYPAGYPDFPMPQLVRSDRTGHRVVVSCTISDLIFEWRLEPAGGGTCISVHVEIPEREAARLAAQREVVTSSLRRLAALASS